MNCPDSEKILQFAAQPPVEADAELAAHIYTCHTCQQTFNLALEMLGNDYQPNMFDYLKAQNIVEATLDTKDYLHELIAWFKDKLDAASSLMLFAEELPLPHSQGEFACAAGMPQQITSRRNPEVHFASKESRLSPHYWEAVLLLPMIMTKTSTLEFHVYDGKENLLQNGTLNFRGKQLPVRNGKTVLTTQDFLESMEGKGISFCFADNIVTEGDIRLQ